MEPKINADDHYHHISLQHHVQVYMCGTLCWSGSIQVVSSLLHDNKHYSNDTVHLHHQNKSLQEQWHLNDCVQ